MSVSVKGWLEDHDFALGKGHGKNKKEGDILLIDDLVFKVENTQELDCNKCKEIAHLQSKYDELYAEYLTSNKAFEDKQ